MHSRNGASRRLVVGVAAALVASLLAVAPAAAQTGAFADVVDDAFYSVPVAALAEDGVFVGTECAESRFCPSESLDRQTMAVWTVRVLDGADSAAVSATRFLDVEPDSFYAPFIERMAELGVTAGCGDGTRFCPDASVTRAQMAVFLTRAFSLAPGPDPGFTDVPADAWYFDQMTALAASSITKGCGDGTRFCPERDTTRAEMATFLYRALHRDGSEQPVRVPTSGEAVVVASGASFVAEFDSVTVEGPAGALSGAARLSVSETRVGAGRTARAEELAADPIAVSVIGAQIVEPLTLRFRVDTESLTPTGVVPAWWSSEVDSWIPLDAQDVVIADGEVIVKATLADARPVDLAAVSGSGATLFAGSDGLGPQPDGGDPTLVEPVTVVVVSLIIFVVAVPVAAVVALKWDSVHDVLKHLFGQVADEPKCDGSKLPEWVEELSHSDQGLSQERARLHICGESEGDELRVRVVNNRNYGIELDASGNDYPVSIPGGNNPPNVLEIAIKKLAEWRIGDSYLWPFSQSEFLLPRQQQDWSGRWRPTANTVIVDGFRIGLDLLRIALPGIDLSDNVKFADCVVDVIERAVDVVESSDPELKDLERWVSVLGEVANCFDSQKSDTSLIGGRLSEKAREGLAQVVDALEWKNLLKYVDSAIKGIKWGLTLADAFKDAQKQAASINVAVDGAVAGAVPPPAGPDRYAEPFSLVAAGAIHTCALSDDDTVACWGDNEHGQTDPPSGAFDAVSAGRSHSCGLRTNGTLACWGLNDRGQASPPAGSVFRGVTSGAGHSCALRDDDTVACWGGNEHGQTDAPGGRFIAISAGGDHSCAVRASGAVVCWGSRLRSGTPSGRFNAVSSGTAHSCGLRTDRTIRCWSGDLFADDLGVTDAPTGEFTAVSAHGDNTCALRSSGDITCWGRSEQAEIEGPFTSVTLGLFHMCATRPNGSVECRGNNDYGQTDVPSLSGDPQSEATSNTQPSVTLFSAVSAGGSHTCALRTDGTITCWGHNGWKRSHLGWTQTGAANAPTGQFSTVSAGFTHSCGLRTDGTITCWGGNDQGQASPPSGQFAAVSASYDHSCGLRTDSTITCWGNNRDGRADAPRGQFLTVSSGADHSCGLRTDSTITCWGGSNSRYAPSGQFKAVVSGLEISCGLRTNRTITCWGPGRGKGQLDPPAGQFSAISAPVGGSQPCGLRINGTITCWGRGYLEQTYAVPAGQFSAISAGSGHACGLETDGTIICFGDNTWGQTVVPTVEFTMVSAGSCALRSDGTITCWGLDDFDQTDSLDAPSGEFSAISSGGLHSCALRTDGTITCWGTNDHGETDAPSGQFIAVSAGGGHSCAVKTNGTIACWGDTRASGSWLVPKDHFSAVSAGGLNACGLRTDGTITCWGDDRYGETDAPSGQFTAVSAGGGHSCAVRTGGTITCWGRNDHGETDAPYGQFTAISAGSEHSCALQTDGTAMCWGRNFHGQTDAPSGQFAAVSAGSRHSCGLRTNGDIDCWGLFRRWSDGRIGSRIRISG